ncbi:MAG: NADH-quinone oxidoreductase subunit C [Bryobacteraceae bacterium]|nr:NADH-quinone oxidoreductase subunit C [Bryobacteraceae bacterium]
MISEQVRQDFPIAAAIEDRNGSWIASETVHAKQLALHVEPSAIVEICTFLRDTFRCRVSGITAVDWHPLEPRFEVVYLLHSIEKNFRIRLKCKVSGEDANIDSVTGVWAGANWYEREVFDLFGISFRNHPNMRRIMMPDDWNGHPLRKDYPIHGHRYSYSDEGNVI